jgi:hypothetical protein
MATCETCKNNYDKTFEVIIQGKSHTFDSFECAIHALAPRCTACGIAIVGHGHEVAGRYYCCANCAKVSGARGPVDRVA